MTLNKGQKLVRMLELMQRRGGVRADELVGRFDIDPRTLRRYLADLRDMGLPVEDTGIGRDRTIALDPAYRRSGVQLTLPEILSLHFGRRLFTFLDGTAFAADMDDAIERLEPAISRVHAQLARELDTKFMAVPEHAKEYGEAGDQIDEIVTALLYNNPAQAEYQKPGGPARRYELEPLTIATYRQGLYLFARDRKDDRIKTFAVERFRHFSRVRVEHFEPPLDYDPEDLVKNAFGIITAPPREVVATFDRQVTWMIRERRWHHTQRLEELDDGRVRATFYVGITQELISWLAGFGGAVEVAYPTELVDRLRDLHRAAWERHGGATAATEPAAP